MAIVTSWQEQGRKEGRKEGEQKAAFGITLSLLKRRFGTVSGSVQARLAQLSSKQLEKLAVALLEFKQASELHDWLNQQVPQKKS